MKCKRFQYIYAQYSLGETIANFIDHGGDVEADGDQMMVKE